MYDPHAISFEQLLETLRDENKLLNLPELNRLSGLSAAEQQQLSQQWMGIPVLRRRLVLDSMLALCEEDVLVSFDWFGFFALMDPDPHMREQGIQILRYEESLDLLEKFSDLLESDDDFRVRAAAAAGLGQYVFLGEIEEIPAHILHTLEERLLEVIRGSDEVLVRRRALEALSFSGRKELVSLIEVAYTSDDEDWMISALFAMGRSANPRWEADVLASLTHSSPDIQLEAVRAAGELELRQAVPLLLDLLEDGDPDVRAASIWSLSQVGGPGVQEILFSLSDDTEDEEESSLLEAALDNLIFTDDLRSLDLLDFDPDDLEDAMHEIDLDED